MVLDCCLREYFLLSSVFSSRVHSVSDLATSVSVPWWSSTSPVSPGRGSRRSHSCRV